MSNSLNFIFDAKNSNKYLAANSISFDSPADIVLINGLNDYSDSNTDRYNQFVLANSPEINSINNENDLKVRPTMSYFYNYFNNPTEICYVDNYQKFLNQLLDPSNPLVHLYLKSNTEYKNIAINLPKKTQYTTSLNMIDYFKNEYKLDINKTNIQTNSGIKKLFDDYNADINYLSDKTNQYIFKIPNYYDQIIMELKNDHMYPVKTTINSINEFKNIILPDKIDKIINLIANLQIRSDISHIDLIDYPKLNLKYNFKLDTTNKFTIKDLNDIKFKLSSSEDINSNALRAYINLHSCCKFDLKNYIEHYKLSSDEQTKIINVNTANMKFRNTNKINLITELDKVGKLRKDGIVDNSLIEIWVDKTDLDKIYTLDEIANEINHHTIIMAANQSGFSQYELMKLNPLDRKNILTYQSTALNLIQNFDNIKIITNCLNNYVVNRLVAIINYAVYRTYDLNKDYIHNQIKLINKKIIDLNFQNIFNEITTLEYLIKLNDLNVNPLYQGFKELDNLIIEFKKPSSSYTDFDNKRKNIRTKIINIKNKLAENNDPKKYNYQNNTYQIIISNLDKITSYIDSFNNVTEQTYLSLTKPKTGLGIYDSGIIIAYYRIRNIIGFERYDSISDKTSTGLLLTVDLDNTNILKSLVDLLLSPQYYDTIVNPKQIQKIIIVDPKQQIASGKNLFYYQFGKYSTDNSIRNRPFNSSENDRSSDYNIWMDNINNYISSSFSLNYVNPLPTDIDQIVKNYNYEDIYTKINDGTFYKSDQILPNKQNNTNKIEALDQLKPVVNIIGICNALKNIKYMFDVFVSDTFMKSLDKITDYFMFIDLSTIYNPNSEVNADYLDSLKNILSNAIIRENNERSWVLFLYLPKIDDFTKDNLQNVQALIEFLKFSLDLDIIYRPIETIENFAFETDPNYLKRKNITLFTFDKSYSSSDVVYHKIAQILARFNSFNKEIYPLIKSNPTKRIIFSDTNVRTESTYTLKINDYFSMYANNGFFDNYFYKIQEKYSKLSNNFPIIDQNTSNQQFSDSNMNINFIPEEEIIISMLDQQLLNLKYRFSTFNLEKQIDIPTNNVKNTNLTECLLIAIGNKASTFEYKVLETYYKYKNANKFLTTKMFDPPISPTELNLTFNLNYQIDLYCLDFKNIPSSINKIVLNTNGGINNYDFSANKNLNSINITYNSANCGEKKSSNPNNSLTVDGFFDVSNTNVGIKNINMTNQTSFFNVTNYYNIINKTSNTNDKLVVRSTNSNGNDIQTTYDNFIDTNTNMFEFASE